MAGHVCFSGSLSIGLDVCESSHVEDFYSRHHF